jgi:hypothetical protein
VIKPIIALFLICYTLFFMPMSAIGLIYTNKLVMILIQRTKIEKLCTLDPFSAVLLYIVTIV